MKWRQSSIGPKLDIFEEFLYYLNLKEFLFLYLLQLALSWIRALKLGTESAQAASSVKTAVWKVVHAF